MNSTNSEPMLMDNFKFEHPATIMIAGPSKSGKTTLLLKIISQLNDGLLAPPPNRIVYCYAVWQDAFEEILKSRAALKNSCSNALMATLEFKEGMPDFDNFDPKKINVLILDDMMTECGKDPRVLDMFTKDSHHKSITVFFLTQNIFPREKYSRSISLNCQYVLLTNNPRDRLQLINFGKQVFPGATKFFAEAFNDAVTQKRYGYLLLDFNQNTQEEDRVQSGVLANEERIIYRKK